MNVSDGVKRFLSDDTVFYSLLVLLVGVTSFGLGKLSERQILPPEQSAAVTLTEAEDKAEIYYVASQKGSKYHLPWCPGAQQMSEENKVFFESETAAKAAGYEPASNCAGL
ncbi:MAG: Ada metal-binding domain-containing protein [Patescibacteria group bacterium]